MKSAAPSCMIGLSDWIGVSGGDGRRTDCTITRSEVLLLASGCRKCVGDACSDPVAFPNVSRLVGVVSILKNVFSVGDTAVDEGGLLGADVSYIGVVGR